MKISKLALSVMVLCGLAGITLADPGSCCPTACEPCGELKTKKKCVGEPTTIKVKKHCWEVECKDICIPKVTMPWDRNRNKCCDPCDTCGKGSTCETCNCCARHRTIKVLKKKDYECEKPGCKFKVVEEVCDASPAPRCCPAPTYCPAQSYCPAPSGQPHMMPAPGTQYEKLPNPPMQKGMPKVN